MPNKLIFTPLTFMSSQLISSLNRFATAKVSLPALGQQKMIIVMKSIHRSYSTEAAPRQQYELCANITFQAHHFSIKQAKRIICKVKNINTWLKEVIKIISSASDRIFLVTRNWDSFQIKWFDGCFYLISNNCDLVPTTLSYQKITFYTQWLFPISLRLLPISLHNQTKTYQNLYDCSQINPGGSCSNISTKYKVSLHISKEFA